MNTDSFKKTRRHNDAPTIADVAREAGVSPMTVSRVINGESSVRTATRIKVEQAITKLNYVPNASARFLAGVKPVHVGLIYDNPSSTYLSEFLIGALEQASRMNVQLSVERSETLDEAMQTAELLLQRTVDGFLLLPPLSDAAELLEFLDERGIPTVVAASDRCNKTVSAVSVDDELAAYHMTKHIIALGHKRIGFIVGNEQQRAGQLRLAGFKRAMKEANLPVGEELIGRGQFTYRSGIEAAEVLLRQNPQPTAVFASNDDMAAATVAVAHRLKLQVPSELTVCGFDDSLMATSIWPELTTIRQPIMDMSRTAIKILVDKIRGHRSDQAETSEHLVLDFTLIQRDSDAAIDAK